jgi:hypothetical protein
MLETLRLNFENIEFYLKNPSICCGIKVSSRSLERRGVRFCSLPYDFRRITRIHNHLSDKKSDVGYQIGQSQDSHLRPEIRPVPVLFAVLRIRELSRQSRNPTHIVG